MMNHSNVQRNPRMVKNGKVDTSFHSSNRNYVLISYAESINYIPNYEFNLVEIEELLGDITIQIDTRFSYFGDQIRIYFNPGSNRKTIHWGSTVSCNDTVVENPCYVELIFDGILYIPSIVLNEKGIGLNRIIKGGKTGSMLFINGSQELSQDAEHLFYNEHRKFLSVGMSTPSTHLSVCGGSNNGQVHILNNNSDNESSIGFGKIGEQPEWVLGAFNDNFCLKNTKTGKTYILSEERNIGKEIGEELEKVVSSIDKKPKSNKK